MLIAECAAWPGQIAEAADALRAMGFEPAASLLRGVSRAHSLNDQQLGSIRALREVELLVRSFAGTTKLNPSFQAE